MQSSQPTRDWESMQNARYMQQQQPPYQYQQTPLQHTKPLRPSQIKLRNDNSNSHHYHHMQPQPQPQHNVNSINNINTNHAHRNMNTLKNNKNLSYHSSPTYSKTTPTYPSSSNSAFLRYHSPIEPDTPSFLQLQHNNRSMSQMSENSFDPNYNAQYRRQRTVKPVLGSSPQLEIHNTHKLALASNGSGSLSAGPQGLYSPESIPSVHSAHSAPNNQLNTNQNPNQLAYTQQQQSKSSFSLPRVFRKKGKKKNKIKQKQAARTRAESAQIQRGQKNKNKKKGKVLSFRDANSGSEQGNFMVFAANEERDARHIGVTQNEYGDDYYHKPALQRSETNPQFYNAPNRQTYGFMRKVDENLELTPRLHQQPHPQQYRPQSQQNVHHSQQQLPHLQHSATYNAQQIQQQQQHLRMTLQNNYTQPIQQNTKYHHSPRPQVHHSAHPSYNIMPYVHNSNNNTGANTQYQRYIPTGPALPTIRSQDLQNINVNTRTAQQRHSDSFSDSYETKESDSSTDYVSTDNTLSESESETQYSASQSQSHSVSQSQSRYSLRQHIISKKSTPRTTIHNIYNRWSHEVDSEPKRLKRINDMGIYGGRTPNTFSEVPNTFHNITPDITPRHSMLLEGRQSIIREELVMADLDIIYYDNAMSQSNSKSLSVQKSHSLVKNSKSLLVNQARKRKKKKTNKGTFSRAINQQYSCELEKPSHLLLISQRECGKTKKSMILLKQALKREILFVGLTDVMIDKMVEKMYQIVVPKNKCIIRQNEIGDAYFVVEEGSFIIIKKKKVVGVAGAKSAFGEGSLLYSRPRSATLRAKQDSIVWALDAKEFTKIRARLTAKKAAKSEKKVKFLRKIQLFSKLHIQDIEDISEAIKPILYRQGAAIITPNDESTHFFIVYKGTCVKKTKRKKKQKIIAQYTHCSYFGEDGIINNKASDYYITASTDVICYVLNAMEFKKILNAIHMMKVNGNTDCNMYTAINHDKFNNICRINDGDLCHIAVIGKGTFGEISLVEDKHTHNTYALKKMRKNRIIDTNQQTQIENERAILCKLDSAFCIKLYATFADDLNVYLLQEAVLGGELFYLLKFNKKFPEKTARFYAGNVILAFEHIHSLNVIFRDLKPEHVLVKQNGYIKLVDYGFSKVRNNSCTLCGTPEYLAPEVIQCAHQSFTTDWWTLGIFIYEMIVGRPPFLDDANVKMYEKILSAAPCFPTPNKISRPGIDIISSLLRKHPFKRLGSGLYPFGCQRVKKHAWFNKFDWQKMEKQEIVPPYVPNVKNKTDASNFQHYQKESVEEALIKDKDGTLFDWCRRF